MEANTAFSQSNNMADVLQTHYLDRIVSQLAGTMTETGKPAGVQGCVRSHPGGWGARGRRLGRGCRGGKGRRRWQRRKEFIFNVFYLFHLGLGFGLFGWILLGWLVCCVALFRVEKVENSELSGDFKDWGQILSFMILTESQFNTSGQILS